MRDINKLEETIDLAIERVHHMLETGEITEISKMAITALKEPTKLRGQQIAVVCRNKEIQANLIRRQAESPKQLREIVREQLPEYAVGNNILPAGDTE